MYTLHFMELTADFQNASPATAELSPARDRNRDKEAALTDEDCDNFSTPIATSGFDGIFFCCAENEND